MRRDRLLERRLRPPAVLAPRGRGHRREADVVAAAPVARDRAESGEACVPPVGGDADAVDACAADDRDSPAALGPGPEHRERVVADERPPRPAAPLDGLAELVLLGREVDPGDQKLRELRDRSVAEVQVRRLRGLGQEVVEHGQRVVEPDQLRRAARAACEPEHLAVRAGDHEVGLRPAAVDRDEQRRAHAGLAVPNCGRCSAPAESRRSTSSSASSYCPTSGCASSAFRATTGSPVRAASTASRS